MLRSPRKVSKTSNVYISSVSALIASIAAQPEAFLAIFAFTLPIPKNLELFIDTDLGID